MSRAISFKRLSRVSFPHQLETWYSKEVLVRRLWLQASARGTLRSLFKRAWFASTIFLAPNQACLSQRTASSVKMATFSKSSTLTRQSTSLISVWKEKLSWSKGQCLTSRLRGRICWWRHRYSRLRTLSRCTWTLSSSSTICHHAP